MRNNNYFRNGSILVVIPQGFSFVSHFEKAESRVRQYFRYWEHSEYIRLKELTNENNRSPALSIFSFRSWPKIYFKARRDQTTLSSVMISTCLFLLCVGMSNRCDASAKARELFGHTRTYKKYENGQDEITPKNCPLSSSCLYLSFGQNIHEWQDEIRISDLVLPERSRLAAKYSTNDLVLPQKDCNHIYVHTPKSSLIMLKCSPF